MYNYSISKKHVNMIEIILARSNQLVIQLNSACIGPNSPWPNLYKPAFCPKRPFYVVPRKSGMARIDCILIIWWEYGQKICEKAGKMEISIKYVVLVILESC